MPPTQLNLVAYEPARNRPEAADALNRGIDRANVTRLTIKRCNGVTIHLFL